MASRFTLPTTLITTTTTNLTTRSHHLHYPFLKNPTRPIYSSSFNILLHQSYQGRVIIKAIEQSKEENNIEQKTTEAEAEEVSTEEKKSIKSELELELEERENKTKKKADDLWSGVVEEIKEIEWPVFGKVVGTTGVVLGVIAGSSVVLLTVNAILAEFSDRVFVGRGVQDFFS